MNNDRENRPSAKSERHGWIPALLMVLAVLAAGWAFYTYGVVGRLTTDVTIESVSVTGGSIEVIGTVNGWAGVKAVDCSTDEDTVTVMVTAVWPVLHKDERFTILLDGADSSAYSKITEIDISDERNALVIWTDD